MKKTITGMLAGIGLGLILFAILWVALLLFSGCKLDPAYGGVVKHDVLTNASVVSNGPALMNQPIASPSLRVASVPTIEAPPPRRLSTAGWEFMDVKRPVREVPLFIVPPNIQWMATQGMYRVVVSDTGSNWWEYACTMAWPRFGATNVLVSVLKPTNLLFKVVSP